MPKFKPQNIQEFTLPSSTKDDPAVVTMDLTVTGGTAEDAIGVSGVNKVTSGMLASAIKSWNFTDADDAPVPITSDNVRHLDAEDFTFLGNKLMNQLNLTVSAQAVSEAEKKAS